MTKSTKIFVFDTDGNTLFDGESQSGYALLQPGDTLWIGSDNNRKWTKVLKVVYGFDTDSNAFVADIFVSLAEKFDKEKLLLTLQEESKPKSELKKNTNYIDHGLIELSKGNLQWVINSGDIIVRHIPHSKCNTVNLRLQIAGKNGPINKSEENIMMWEFLEIIDDKRQVICTVHKISNSGVTINVTETIFN